MTREQEIMQRAREIRYGDGCGADEAIRRATEEFAEWDKLYSEERGK